MTIVNEAADLQVGMRFFYKSWLILRSIYTKTYKSVKNALLVKIFDQNFNVLDLKVLKIRPLVHKSVIGFRTPALGLFSKELAR